MRGTFCGTPAYAAPEMVLLVFSFVNVELDIGQEIPWS